MLCNRQIGKFAGIAITLAILALSASVAQAAAYSVNGEVWDPADGAAAVADWNASASWFVWTNRTNYSEPNWLIPSGGSTQVYLFGGGTATVTSADGCSTLNLGGVFGPYSYTGGGGVGSPLSASGGGYVDVQAGSLSVFSSGGSSWTGANGFPIYFGPGTGEQGGSASTYSGTITQEGGNVYSGSVIMGYGGYNASQAIPWTSSQWIQTGGTNTVSCQHV